MLSPFLVILAREGTKVQASLEHVEIHGVRELSNTCDTTHLHLIYVQS